MDRRDALQVIGAAVLGRLVAPLSALERWTLGGTLHARIAGSAQAPRALTVAQMAEVRALAETILPRTDTPGAVDVGAPEFIDLLVAEWYTDAERQQLLAGLDALTARSRASRGKSIAELDGGARTTFVASVDGQQGSAGTPEWAYARIKDQLIFAFLTSKAIAPLVNSTPVIPGRFDGCVPV